jgi:hypothetical protein
MELFIFADEDCFTGNVESKEAEEADEEAIEDVDGTDGEGGSSSELNIALLQLSSILFLDFLLLSLLLLF